MVQKTRKRLGFKKIMVYKIPLGVGEVNHIWPLVYKDPSFLHADCTDLVCNSVCFVPLAVSDWFHVNKRTDSWPNGRQCAVWLIFGVRFGKLYIEMHQTAHLKHTIRYILFPFKQIFIYCWKL